MNHYRACTCIMVINKYRVARCTFAGLTFVLFKFMKDLILLVQACSVSTHPPTTKKSVINLCTFIMNCKPQF